MTIQQLSAANKAMQAAMKAPGTGGLGGATRMRELSVIATGRHHTQAMPALSRRDFLPATFYPPPSTSDYPSGST